MKNPYEVLRQKEAALLAVRAEIEALRLVAPLLAEPRDEQEFVAGGKRERSSEQI